MPSKDAENAILRRFQSTHCLTRAIPRRHICRKAALHLRKLFSCCRPARIFNEFGHARTRRPGYSLRDLTSNLQFKFEGFPGEERYSSTTHGFYVYDYNLQIALRSRDPNHRMSSSGTNSMSSLPELPYSLHTKKGSIATQWGTLLLPTCVLTLILYFAIKHGTHVHEDIGRSRCFAIQRNKPACLKFYLKL